MVAGSTLTLLPKEQEIHDLAKIRPILLFEVIRKFWASMVAKLVQRVTLISTGSNQSYTCLEGAHTDEPIFIIFWDIRRAFELIPK
jgi:hypothetical protein